MGAARATLCRSMWSDLTTPLMGARGDGAIIHLKRLTGQDTHLEPDDNQKDRREDHRLVTANFQSVPQNNNDRLGRRVWVELEIIEPSESEFIRLDGPQQRRHAGPPPGRHVEKPVS